MNTLKQIQTIIFDAEKDMREGTISNNNIHRLLRDLKIALQKLEGQFRYLAENSQNYKSELYRLYSQFKQNKPTATSNSQSQFHRLSKSKNRISQSSENSAHKNMSILPIHTDKLSQAAFPLQNSSKLNEYGMEKKFQQKTIDNRCRNSQRKNSNRLSSRERSGKIARKVNQNYFTSKSPPADNLKKSKNNLRNSLSGEKRHNWAGSLRKSSTYGNSKENRNPYEGEQDLIDSIRSFKKDINEVQNFVQQHCKANHNLTSTQQNPYSHYQPLQQKIHTQLLSLNNVQSNMLQNLQKQIHDSRIRLMQQIRKIKKNLTNESKILKKDQFEKQFKNKHRNYL